MPNRPCDICVFESEGKCLKLSTMHLGDVKLCGFFYCAGFIPKEGAPCSLDVKTGGPCCECTKRKKCEKE